MGLSKFLGVLSPVHIGVFTKTIGATLLGTDPAGNKYYRAAPKTGYKLERRWVIYKGDPEASAVPPEFHAWLHHQSDIFPEKAKESFRRPWQKPYLPNLTGTPLAYRPPGHLLKGGIRPKATGDYEAWRPGE